MQSFFGMERVRDGLARHSRNECNWSQEEYEIRENQDDAGRMSCERTDGSMSPAYMHVAEPT